MPDSIKLSENQNIPNKSARKASEHIKSVAEMRRKSSMSKSNTKADKTSKRASRVGSRQNSVSGKHKRNLSSSSSNGIKKAIFDSSMTTVVENETMTEEEKIEFVFAKRPEERSHEDIEFIGEITKNVTLFQKLQKEQHEMVCTMLRLEIINKDQIIFREGEIGDKFYIVLKGKVDVLKKIVLKKNKGIDGTIHESKNKRVALLGSGTFFGELALMRSVPRACTCKTLERTVLAVLSKDDYQALLMQNDMDALKAKMQVLRTSSLFTTCTDKELTYISYFFQDHTYGRGDYILRAGETKEVKLYVIAAGQCQVVAKIEETSHHQSIPTSASSELEEDPHSTPLHNQRFTANRSKRKQSKVLTMSCLGKGQYFGAEYMFNKETMYHESLVAVTEVKMFVMNKVDFFKRLRPSILQSIKLMAELRQTWRSGRISFLTTNSTATSMSHHQNSHGATRKRRSTYLKPIRISDKPRSSISIGVGRISTTSQVNDDNTFSDGDITNQSSTNFNNLESDQNNYLSKLVDINKRKKPDMVLDIANPPFGVEATTPWQALYSLDSSHKLWRDESLTNALTGVSPSSSYLKSFTKQKAKEISSRNTNDINDTVDTSSTASIPPVTGALYRSFGAWNEVKAIASSNGNGPVWSNYNNFTFNTFK